MKQPLLQKVFHHGRHSPPVVEIFHQVFSAGLQIGQHGHPVADALKI